MHAQKSLPRCAVWSLQVCLDASLLSSACLCLSKCRFTQSLCYKCRFTQPLCCRFCSFVSWLGRCFLAALSGSTARKAAAATQRQVTWAGHQGSTSQCATLLSATCDPVQVILPLMQPMLDPETVPVHPGRALLELCQQQGKQLRFAVASTLPDALLLAAQTLGLPEGEAPSAELVALAAEAATKVSVGSPAAEAGTGAAAGAAGSAEKAGATAPLAAGGNGAQAAANGTQMGCVLRKLCLHGPKSCSWGLVCCFCWVSQSQSRTYSLHEALGISCAAPDCIVQILMTTSSHPPQSGDSGLTTNCSDLFLLCPVLTASMLLCRHGWQQGG